MKNKEQTNIDNYSLIKDISKRYTILKDVAIHHPEDASKDFFLAAFKKNATWI